MGIIIRNDDVNPNTDYKELMEMYDIILKAVPNAEIWTVWSVINRKLATSNLYPDGDLPIKEKPLDYFYRTANQMGLPLEGGRYGKICSHGMLHICHKDMPIELQEMSIVTSCFLLRTKVFVPPFSESDKNTEIVCNKFGIELVKREEWMPLDYKDFDPSHKKWYFHSWRYTPDKLREKFAHACERVG